VPAAATPAPKAGQPTLLYAVAIDDISNLRQLITSLRHPPERPAPRVYLMSVSLLVITLPPCVGFAI